MSERVKESWKVKDKKSQHVSSLSSFSSTCNQITDYQHGWPFSQEKLVHTPIKKEKEAEDYSYTLGLPEAKIAEGSSLYSSFQVKQSPESHGQCSSISNRGSPVKFWEENNELSVLDFLETHYQEQESSVDMRNYVSERLRMLMFMMENNSRRVRRKHKIRSTGTKKLIKRFKGLTNENSFTYTDDPVVERYNNETKFHSDFQSSENLVPYSSLLKSICQKEFVALRCTDSSSKIQIFRPLDPEEVKYPYAGILQSFCCKTKEKDDVDAWHCARTSRKRKNLSDIHSVGDIMKEIKYPMINSAAVDIEGNNYSCVFSKKLLSAVKKSKMDDVDSSGPLSHSSVGAVLQETLSTTGDAYLPSEFYSCVLLQKLSQEASLGIKQEEDTLEDGFKGSRVSRIKLSKVQRTTSRSNSLDAGDLTFTSHSVDTSQSVLEQYLQNQDDVKMNCERASASSDDDFKESIVSSSRLLQLLARRSSKELDSYMRFRENQILPSSKQNKHFQNDKVSSSSFRELKKESSENASSVLQILLQQASSRSFTENDKADESIPRIDSEFLFSRMLQNFKLQVEAKQPQEDCEDKQDHLTLAEVLRGMGSSSEHHLRDKEEESSCDRLVVPSLDGRCLTMSEVTKVTQKDKRSTRQNTLLAHGRQKYDEDEKNFECNICCLQFTSHSDLTNHQTIFHMSEATPNTCPADIEGGDGLVSLILHDRLKAQ